MRVVFIGCVNFSFSALDKLLTLKNAEVVGIVTRKGSSYNADFCSLESLAFKAGIPCFFFNVNNQSAMAQWIRVLNPDVIYCFGWSSILKEEILSVPPLGVVGYHPAALPQNRGRHPIVWALALGLNKTASTFFFMDEGIDSGDILSQQFIDIEESDDAATLYQKLTIIALDQIANFTKQLASNKYPRISQDHTLANNWRKREKRDGQIDWRMTVASIHNLVRALTRPYVGAHYTFEGTEIKIWKTELIHLDLVNIEPGKVLKVEGPNIIVKCGTGAIKLVEHDFEILPKEGWYL